MRRPNFGILLIMLAATLAIAGGALAKYLGTFKDVVIHEIESPGFTILVKNHAGPYHEIVPTINEVELWATQNQIPCTKTLGEFLDDPNKAEPARLRARVGCWVGPGRITLALPPPPDMQIEFVEPGPMLEADFAGSPAIGPWKVYPQVKGYLADHQKLYQLPNFEIYTIENEKRMTTQYLFTMR
jgi:hypothetical protein